MEELRWLLDTIRGMVTFGSGKPCWNGETSSIQSHCTCGLGSAAMSMPEMFQCLSGTVQRKNTDLVSK